MTVAERIENNKTNANIEVLAEGTGFSKSMPTPFDLDGQLNEGDVLHIPEKFVVNKQTFDFVNAKGEHPTGEFIVIKVTHEGEQERSINFFPTSLTKAIWRATKDANGTVSTVPGGPLHPKGTAVEEFTSMQGKGTEQKTDTQLGMEKLAGKKIVISAKTPYDTQVWEKGKRTNATQVQYLYTYDLQK